VTVFYKTTTRNWRDAGSTVYSVSPLIVGPFENVWQVPYTFPFMMDEVVSANTPSYSLKIKNGDQLPSNAYSKQKHKLTGDFSFVRKVENFVSGYGIVRYFETRVIPFGSMFGYGGFTRSADFNLAELELLKKLKGESWQSGVALVEAGKVSSMVTKTATNLVQAASALRKGHLGTAMGIFGLFPSNRKIKRFNSAYGKDPREAAANMWLELQYGWKPLLKDVDDAFKALTRLHDRPASFIHKISTVKKKSGGSFTASYVWSVSPAGSGELLIDWAEDYKIALVYTVDNDFYSRVQSVDLLNPLGTAWELIPFSFVADWFIPIGDYLNTLDACLGKTFVRGTRSYRLREHHTLTVKSYALANHSVGGGYESEHYGKVRERLTSFPNPSLPSVNVKLGLEKMISSVALLNNELRKFGRG
jgi:hypothetical protein